MCISVHHVHERMGVVVRHVGGDAVRAGAPRCADECVEQERMERGTCISVRRHVHLHCWAR